MKLILEGLSDREKQIEKVKSLSEELISAFNNVLRDNGDELPLRMKVKAAAVATWVIRQSYTEDSHHTIGATFKNTYELLKEGEGI